MRFIIGPRETLLVLRPKTYSMQVHKKLDFTSQNASDNPQQMHSAIMCAATRGAIVGISVSSRLL